jgi:hypothetical protein
MMTGPAKVGLANPLPQWPDYGCSMPALAAGDCMAAWLKHFIPG